MSEINDGHPNGDEHHLFEKIDFGVAFVVAVSKQAGRAVYYKQGYEGKEDDGCPDDFVACGFLAKALEVILLYVEEIVQLRFIVFNFFFFYFIYYLFLSPHKFLTACLNCCPLSS